MKKVSVCIFDMDGLLVDSEKGMWLINEEKTLIELGYQFDSKYFIDHMGSSFINYKNSVINRYGQDFDFDNYFNILVNKNIELINNGELKLMPGALELLKFLNDNNIACRIATSTENDLANTILNKLNIKHYFERIVTGDEVKNGKPAPDIYLKALDTCDKDEALIFEDSHNGSLAALSSGVALMLVPDVSPVTIEDKQKAFKVINNLSEAINIIKDINNIK